MGLAMVTSIYHFIVYRLFPLLQNKLSWRKDLVFLFNAISLTLKPEPGMRRPSVNTG